MHKTYFKQKTNRDENYKRFIRSMPCIICGSTPSEHSHEPLNGRGMGHKGPDNESLPLCAFHHRIAIRNRHNTAPDRFYGDHGIDWRYEVKLYQKLYAADRAAKGE